MGKLARAFVASLAMTCALVGLAPDVAAQTVSGAQQVWHTITLDFAGPSTSEGAAANPFLDYRLDLDVTAPDGRTFTVPGYYACDGNAAQTSATSGDVWRVHLVPDSVGAWSYAARFRTGTEVAVSDQATAGTATGFDGASGTLDVTASTASGRDLRAHGRLQYTGERYLRWAGTGAPWLKGGADSPENFLAYWEFDGTTNEAGGVDSSPLMDGLHRYAPHAGDWNAGDPQWQTNKGRNIVGALNYLASKGMNSVYFLTMNVTGDGRDTWPWTSSGARTRYDCSKLDQWDIVFGHMERQGLAMHVVTQETENDQLLDGGALGTQRRLYYRELVARFGYHLAVVWNLGEENTNTNAQRAAFAQWFEDNDPWGSPVVIHTYPGDKQAVYPSLLGNAALDGPSLQNGNPNQSHDTTIEWIDRSSMAGHPWFVCVDEIGPAGTGVTADGAGNNHDQMRKEVLWANLMAGGAGVEWYFGYNTMWNGERSNDISCEDWRSRDAVWTQTRYALDFFENHLPFDQMTHADGLTAQGDDYVLALPGVAYAVYRPDGGAADLDIGAGTYDVRWYDPRSGGALQTGPVATITGPGTQSIGAPPSATTSDWVALVELAGNVETYTLTVTNGAGSGDYPAGAAIPITAGQPPAGQTFDLWTGDTAVVADVAAASTTVTMPAADAALTATYRQDDGARVVSFTLIDADADAAIPAFDPLGDGSILNLARLPSRNLNVVANTQPQVVGQVTFELDGAVFATEGVAPYALAGDTDGDFGAWTPTVGMHTLTATLTDDTGMAGTPLTIAFEVIDDPNANTPPSVSFIDPSDGTSVPAGAPLDAAVRALDVDGTVAEVTLEVAGAPIALTGPTNDVWTASGLDTSSPGPLTLTAIATDDGGATATATVTVIVMPLLADDVADAGSDATTGADATGDGAMSAPDTTSAADASADAEGELAPSGDGSEDGCCTQVRRRGDERSPWSGVVLALSALVALVVRRQTPR